MYACTRTRLLDYTTNSVPFFMSIILNVSTKCESKLSISANGPIQVLEGALINYLCTFFRKCSSVPLKLFIKEFKLKSYLCVPLNQNILEELGIF